MATNPWYTNSTNTIIDFTVANAADVENKCDDIADGFDALEVSLVALEQSLGKYVRHASNELDAITELAAERVNKVIGLTASAILS